MSSSGCVERGGVRAAPLVPVLWCVEAVWGCLGFGLFFPVSAAPSAVRGRSLGQRAGRRRRANVTGVRISCCYVTDRFSQSEAKQQA